MNYYEVLGVPENAPASEIKLAYRRLAATWHPDRNADPAAEDTFVEIQKAYDCLKDPERRDYYDRHGRDQLTAVEQNARAAVLQRFIQIADQKAWEPAQYIALLRLGFTKQIENATQEISDLEAKVEHLGSVIPKAPAGAEENLFLGALEHAKECCREQAGRLLDSVQIAEKALELISDYEDTAVHPEDDAASNSHFYITSGAATA